MDPLKSEFQILKDRWFQEEGYKLKKSGWMKTILAGKIVRWVDGMINEMMKEEDDTETYGKECEKMNKGTGQMTEEEKKMCSFIINNLLKIKSIRGNTCNKPNINKEMQEYVYCTVMNMWLFLYGRKHCEAADNVISSAFEAIKTLNKDFDAEGKCRKCEYGKLDFMEVNGTQMLKYVYLSMEKKKKIMGVTINGEQNEECKGQKQLPYAPSLPPPFPPPIMNTWIKKVAQSGKRKQREKDVKKEKGEEEQENELEDMIARTWGMAKLSEILEMFQEYSEEVHEIEKEEEYQTLSDLCDNIEENYKVYEGCMDKGICKILIRNWIMATKKPDGGSDRGGKRHWKDMQPDAKCAILNLWLHYYQFNICSILVESEYISSAMEGMWDMIQEVQGREKCEYKSAYGTLDKMNKAEIGKVFEWLRRKGVEVKMQGINKRSREECGIMRGRCWGNVKGEESELRTEGVQGSEKENVIKEMKVKGGELIRLKEEIEESKKQHPPTQPPPPPPPPEPAGQAAAGAAEPAPKSAPAPKVIEAGKEASSPKETLGKVNCDERVADASANFEECLSLDGDSPPATSSVPLPNEHQEATASSGPVGEPGTEVATTDLTKSTLQLPSAPANAAPAPEEKVPVKGPKGDDNVTGANGGTKVQDNDKGQGTAVDGAVSQGGPGGSHTSGGGVPGGNNIDDDNSDPPKVPSSIVSTGQQDTLTTTVHSGSAPTQTVPEPAENSSKQDGATPDPTGLSKDREKPRSQDSVDSVLNLGGGAGGAPGKGPPGTPSPAKLINMKDNPVLPYLPLAPATIGIMTMSYLLWKYFSLPSKRKRYRRVPQVHGPVTLEEQLNAHVAQDDPREYTLVKERKPRSTPKKRRKKTSGHRGVRRRMIIDIHLEVLNECEKGDLHSTKEDFFEILVQEFMGSELIKEEKVPSSDSGFREGRICS